MAQEITIRGTQGNPAEVTPQGALKVDLVSDDTSSLAQESTLNSVKINTDPNARKYETLRPTGSATITDKIYRGSVANVGLNNGTFDGTVIKPGEVLPIDPGGGTNNYFAAGTVPYDATGTEFLIEYSTDV